MQAPLASPIDISTRRTLRIAGPVIVNQLTFTLMGVVDMIMVGQLGVRELAGVGLAGMISGAVFSFFVGMFNGVNTLVAQAVGARDTRAAGVALWQGAYLALLATAALLAVWALVPALLRWSGATAEVQAVAVPYMRLRLLGGLGVTAIALASNFYYGIGRARAPMLAAFLQLALNCGFNYALIFGKLGAPTLGSDGAAIGTSLAQWLVGGLLCASLGVAPALRRGHALLATWRWQPRIFATLVRLSLPVGGQIFLEVASLAVFLALISRLGDAPLAASNAVFHSWSLAFMVGVGLSVSATTLVGQCIGAGRPEDARRVAWRVLRLGYGVMAAAAIVFLALPEHIMGVFVDAAELERLRPFARPLFTLVSVAAVFDMQFTVLLGALRGAGDVDYPMLVNLCCPWLLFVPATIAVAPRLGVAGAWGCLLVNYVLMAALMTRRVRGSAWLKPPRPRAGGEPTALH